MLFTNIKNLEALLFISLVGNNGQGFRFEKSEEL